MLTELPRLCSAAIAVTILLWHSGHYARQFGFALAKRAFYLRYTVLTKSPGSDI
ncbi:MAG: hypothetical protein OEO19_11125 [Gammaproteobacteria bacterium]|nr:hypothetical protein [Gammaproteobacteria bacterium]MDH3449952.1 hypothetical protein [Gammaproteobacteria bacterium]